MIVRNLLKMRFRNVGLGDRDPLTLANSGNGDTLYFGFPILST